MRVTPLSGNWWGFFFVYHVVIVPYTNVTSQARNRRRECEVKSDEKFMTFIDTLLYNYNFNEIIETIEIGN